MTVFWSIAALLAAVALAFVLPPLLGRRRATGAATPDAANVAIHRDQLRELDADLAAGTLSPEQRDEARREIEQRLLDDVRTGDGARAAAASGRRTAMAVAAAVPRRGAAAVFRGRQSGRAGARRRDPRRSRDHPASRSRAWSSVSRHA